MIPVSLIDPRVFQVRPDSVREYMLAHGWQLQPHPRKDVLLFGGKWDEDGLEMTQPFPGVLKGRDYGERVLNLLQALEILEDRPAADILTEMWKYQAEATANHDGCNGASASAAPPARTAD
jgi:hypothetical protein